MWEDLSRMHKGPWRSEPWQKRNMMQGLPAWPGGGHTVPSPALPSPTPVLEMEGSQALVLCIWAWAEELGVGGAYGDPGLLPSAGGRGVGGLLTRPCAFSQMALDSAKDGNHYFLWRVSTCCLVNQSCPTVSWLHGLAHQAPLFMAFPRQEYWNGLSFPSQGDLPNPGVKPAIPHIAGRFFTAKPPREPKTLVRQMVICYTKICNNLEDARLIIWSTGWFHFNQLVLKCSCEQF